MIVDLAAAFDGISEAIEIEFAKLIASETVNIGELESLIAKLEKACRPNEARLDSVEQKWPPSQPPVALAPKGRGARRRLSPHALSAETRKAPRAIAGPFSLPPI